MNGPAKILLHVSLSKINALSAEITDNPEKSGLCHTAELTRWDQLTMQFWVF